MKKKKRHTLLKFLILAVMAGGVVLYSGVLQDTGGFPGQIRNQVYVEQKNAKAENHSGAAEKKTEKRTEISTENGTPEIEVTHGYAYETLTAEQQAVYDEVYRIIMAQDSKVKVSTCKEKVLEKAYRSVIADHGEIFWVSGYNYTQYTMGKKIVSIDFSPSYTMGRTERDYYQSQIDVVVDSILKNVDPSWGDYEKAKYVFEYLAGNIEYEMGTEQNQNIISVFLNKKTVCQGYANATQYLLTLLGIPAVVVTGTAEGDTHAWNLVQLDGAYYFMDTTWGNSSYNNGESGFSSFINYNYFGVTTAEISKTHQADGTLLLPDCTATADNYYVREGKYITEWNPDVVGQIYGTAYQNGAVTEAVRFLNTSLYDQAKGYLIDEQHIRDYCEGITGLSYIEDRDQNVLILKFS